MVRSRGSKREINYIIEFVQTFFSSLLVSLCITFLRIDEAPEQPLGEHLLYRFVDFLKFKVLSFSINMVARHIALSDIRRNITLARRAMQI